MRTTSVLSRLAKVICGASVACYPLFASMTATAGSPCSEVLGGDWTYQDSLCASSVTSIRDATMTMSVGLPLEIIGDATAGRVLRRHLRDRVDTWRRTGATMVRANESRIDSQIFTHGSVASVVLHEFQQTVGSPPNDAYSTFTFDLAGSRRLQLADLFKPGVDPLTALPPLARPYLAEALDRAAPPHDPGTYPFTTDKFEPQPDGSGYSGNYRAFAITPDEFILYLPDLPMTHETPWPRDRFVWSMDGGTVVVHVPLAALSTILR